MDDKTMLEQECDGDCGQHHGPVLLTTVVDERDGSEWEFFYCDAAREIDTRNGFSVTVAAAEIGKAMGRG